MNKLIFTLLLLIPSLSFADLKSDFEALNGITKGPFSKNYLQGKSERTTIESGRYPSGVLFQAAYRNSAARVLSEQHAFYVGNLYTTNYYELMGEFVYGDAYGSHDLNHQALLDNSSQAMPKASLMAQHWVLEKFYMQKNPRSKIARAFLLRGISGAEFEAEYARYFFRFFLTSMTDDFQYLVAGLLIQDSPVVDTKGLKRARSVIAEIYDDYAQRYGSRNDMVRKIYKVRNAIHNQLSPKAVDMIDDLLGEYSGLRDDRRFANVRANLEAYFSYDVDNLVDSAESLKLEGFAGAAKTVESQGTTPQNLLALSRQLAALKTALVYEKSINSDTTPDVLALITKASSYLAKELSFGSDVGSREYIEALANTIYSEGFLIKDNWEYYQTQIQSSDQAGAKSLLNEIVYVATDTLFYAFENTLPQWIEVDSGMNQFQDSVIKASSLDAATKNL